MPEAPQPIEIVDAKLNTTAQLAETFGIKQSDVGKLIDGLKKRIDDNTAKGLFKAFSSKLNSDQVDAVKADVAQRLNNLTGQLVENFGVDLSTDAAFAQFEAEVKKDLNSSLTQAIANPAALVSQWRAGLNKARNRTDEYIASVH